MPYTWLREHCLKEHIFDDYVLIPVVLLSDPRRTFPAGKKSCPYRSIIEKLIILNDNCHFNTDNSSIAVAEDDPQQKKKPSIA